jgi:hypothetical protein
MALGRGKGGEGAEWMLLTSQDMQSMCEYMCLSSKIFGGRNTLLDVVEDLYEKRRPPACLHI